MAKKLFCSLVLAAVAALSAAGALAAIPHTHGKDYDHSQNADCVFYQLSLSPFQAESAAAQPFDFGLTFTLVVIFVAFSAESLSAVPHPGRAPPKIL